MKLKNLLTAATASMIIFGTQAFATEAPVKKADGILVAASGMTLYVFDKDASGSGKSTCNGPCAALWPALKADDGDNAAGDYTIIARDDGTRQWALKGKPLYFWANDKKPGDKTGDNFKEVWHVVPQ